ncbi:hypothetical protein HSHS1_05280 [Helicobacter suis HS1]|nr:hypothetical protein HSHS1_05280 [Helicobacter suis HS1]
MILIDRDDRRGLASLIKVAKEKLDQGRPLVIFPEGTRGRGEGALVLLKAFEPDLSTNWYQDLEAYMQAEYTKHYQELHG